jgi:hypothetical protein
MKSISIGTFLLASGLTVFAAQEEPVDSRFKATTPDPTMGDWQGTVGYIAQVVPTEPGQYQANLFRAFDETDAKPLAILKGDAADLNGDGWKGAIAHGRFKASKGGESFDLQPITRTSPTLGAKPPQGAIVLYDGKNLDAWAKKQGKEWLKEDGPAKWKILADGVLEVVPASDCIITKQKFGDCHVHVEFRTLGVPTNSGVYLQTRYEVNINETYGKLDGGPNAGFDNCTDNARPRIRAGYPPLEWQTFDIDFRAPRFDASGKKTENARATVLFNGVKVYDQQSLNQPKGAANRLGEAPTGPLMLQEHGMPVQFRNIWVVESGG